MVHSPGTSFVTWFRLALIFLTRNYSQPDWAALSPQERSKLMARQGHSFATAQDVRVVYQLPENSSDPVVLKDVPRDGKTIGEIITRGNM
jgi:hypothetical protein